MKRIVKETNSNGYAKYRVQTNRLMGFIPCRWCTLTYWNRFDEAVDAVFDSYQEALAFASKEKRKVRRLEVWNSRDGLVRGDKIDDYD